MSSTKTQVLAKFAATYPQCEPSLQSQIFDDVNREIASRIQCRNSVQTVNLTAGQQEYNWDPSGYVTQIHEVYYLPSGTTGAGIQLFQMDIDKLAEEMTNWRQGTTPAIPQAWYISSAPANANSTGGQGVIGFWPPPPTTTSAGYPVVSVYVSSAQPLAGGDTVPVQLLNDYVYLYRMYELFANQRVPDEPRQWGKLAEGEFERNIAFVKQTAPLAGTGLTGPNQTPSAGSLYIQGQATKEYIIQRFLQVYQQCSYDVAQTLFDDGNKEIVTRVQLRNTSLDIPIVAGQLEYTYDPTGAVVMVHEAYYLPTADQTSWQVLYEVSNDELAQIRRGWRSSYTSGTPLEYYISSTPANPNNTGGQGTVGLWPPPYSTTIGSPPNNYPKVRLFVCNTAPMALTDATPVQLLNASVYLFYMALRFAELFKPEDVGRWYLPGDKETSYFEREMQKNVALVKDLQDQTTTIFQPGWLGPGSAYR